MPHVNEMPRANEMPPLKKGDAPADDPLVVGQDVAQRRHHGPRSPRKKGDAPVDSPFVVRQDVAQRHHHGPRSPLKKGDAPVDSPFVVGQDVAQRRHHGPRSPLKQGDVLADKQGSPTAMMEAFRLIVERHDEGFARLLEQQRADLADLVETHSTVTAVTAAVTTAVASGLTAFFVEHNAAHHLLLGPRPPLNKGHVDDSVDEQAAGLHLQLLLDEHAARTRREAAHQGQYLLVERDAHARQEAEATRALMAELDGLIAAFPSDMAALQAELEAAPTLLSLESASAPVAVADSQSRVMTLTTAASTPSLHPFGALMVAYKMMDRGGTLTLHGEPYPLRMRTRDKRPRRRVCRRHGPRAPNLLVSLLCGRRHRPHAPNDCGGWD